MNSMAVLRRDLVSNDTQITDTGANNLRMVFSERSNRVVTVIGSSIPDLKLPKRMRPT